MRRRFARPAIRRKVDATWAGLVFSDAATPIGDELNLFADWVRVPSGAFDTVQNLNVPTQYTLIDTVTKWELELDVTASAIGQSIIMRWDYGIIAMQGFNGDAIPTEVPVPLSANDPWVWRGSFMFRESWLAAGSFKVHAWNRFEPEAMVRSRGQRKLPDGVGLLGVLSVEVVVPGIPLLTYGWTIQTDTVCRFKLP